MLVWRQDIPEVTELKKLLPSLANVSSRPGAVLYVFAARVAAFKVVPKEGTPKPHRGTARASAPGCGERLHSSHIWLVNEWTIFQRPQQVMSMTSTFHYGVLKRTCAR